MNTYGQKLMLGFTQIKLKLKYSFKSLVATGSKSMDSPVLTLLRIFSLF